MRREVADSPRFLLTNKRGSLSLFQKLLFIFNLFPLRLNIVEIIVVVAVFLQLSSKHITQHIGGFSVVRCCVYFAAYENYTKRKKITKKCFARNLAENDRLTLSLSRSV